MNIFSDIRFPVCRAYSNGLTWIRIESPDHFTEIRKIGSRYVLSEHEVKILPDRNHVYDLVFNYDSFAIEIEPDVFDKMLDLASK